MLDSGLLNIYKHKGISSFRAVSVVKRALGCSKAGHCGTLDPMAEGVLLVLFGKATKLQETMMDLPKTYLTGILLGTTTDTCDLTGKVLETKEVPDGIESRIPEVLNNFMGEIEQVPPMHSALKCGGVRLYEFARKGIEMPRAARKITVYGIERLGYGDKTLALRIKCSRGTYIRTIAEDIGKALGTGAVMSSLVREAIGPFNSKDAIRIDGTGMSPEELLQKAVGIEEITKLSEHL